VTVTEASPRRDQSLRGHTAKAAEGFPRHYPPATPLEEVGLGFAVMSGFARKITPAWGKLSPIPFSSKGADYAFISTRSSMISDALYPRLPLGFMHAAIRTISCRPANVKCSLRSIRSHM